MRTFLLTVLALSISLSFPGTDVEARPSKKITKKAKQAVAYSGILQDENLNPISGVYPLRFGLYRSPTGRRAIWTNRLWVSVDSGRYTINLGEGKPIPGRLKLEELYVGVSIDGVGEVLREKLIQESPTTPPQGPNTVQPASPPKKADKSTSRSSNIADRAMHAFEADHAVNADKIGNLTVEDLKRTIVKPVKIGSRTRETGQAGGPGGKFYEENCPKGYVVTGIRGGSGKYLDSISLICSPLEQ